MDIGEQICSEVKPVHDLVRTLHERYGEENPPGWYKIGEAGVDSGTLCVMDPCYHYDMGLGVTFPSGLGDGSYPVFARFEYVPLWGMRVAEVRIDLQVSP